MATKAEKKFARSLGRQIRNILRNYLELYPAHFKNEGYLIALARIAAGRDEVLFELIRRFQREHFTFCPKYKSFMWREEILDFAIARREYAALLSAGGHIDPVDGYTDKKGEYREWPWSWTAE
jgi:hypothetical protein